MIGSFVDLINLVGYHIRRLFKPAIKRRPILWGFILFGCLGLDAVLWLSNPWWISFLIVIAAPVSFLAISSYWFLERTQGLTMLILLWLLFCCFDVAHIFEAAFNGNFSDLIEGLNDLFVALFCIGSVSSDKPPTLKHKLKIKLPDWVESTRHIWQPAVVG